MKIAASIFKTFFLSLCIIANTHLAFAQTASILPQGKTQFLDNNAKPLTSGTVDFYTGNVSSTTRKTTWQNSGETIANTNPVVLDAGGRAIIYGDGAYRQVVKDRLGNLIWDQLTSSTGSGGSSPTQTGDGDLVGTIKPWAGMTAPNQYVFTYGEELTRSGFPELFTAITSIQSVTCNSGSPILNGLTDTTNFPIFGAIEISCISGSSTTIVSKTSSTVTMAVNAIVNTTTNATFLPWGGGNHVTTFNVPDFRGVPITGNNNMGGTASSNASSAFFGQNPNAVGALGGGQSTTLVTANLPAYTPAGTVATTVTPSAPILTSVGGNSITPPGSVQFLAVTGGAVTFPASSIFTGTAQGGASTSFSRIIPTVTSNYIIKVTPDTNSAIASGVTILGGMTGNIACGANLSCTGNTISVVGAGTGTVTSVGLTAPSIFTVGGSPITSSGTLTLTANGTAGGIPYFDTSSTMASTSALTASRIVLGGGATGPTVLGSLGTTATVLHGNAAGAPSFSAVVSTDLNITTTNCTNQFVTAISATAVGTCTGAILASAQFANQGTTTTLLHGNAAGNPSWSAVVSADLNITTTTCTNQFITAISSGSVGTCTTDVLASAQHANQGTTTTVLHGNAAGNPSFAAISLTSDVTAALPIANGGTSQITALAARSSSGLNIDEATSIGDTNGTIAASDRGYYHTALTAARTDTLPAANAVNAGQKLSLLDPRGASTASNTVIVARAGADTVNGGTTFTAINSAFGIAECFSDGVSRWNCQQFAGGGGGSGTVTSVTAGGGLTSSPSPITTSGTISLRVPTRQVLTTGTGATYTTAAGVSYIRITGCGGGGGGAGSGSASNGNGGTGGTTTFSGGTLSATGGGGGNGTTAAGGAGGTGTNGAPNVTGSNGFAGNVAVAGTVFQGAVGGANYLCGTAGGTTAVANSGAGGQGGAMNGAGTAGPGGGGGGGFQFIIGAPAGTYTYTIGASGTAGAAGTSGAVGSQGATGSIIVDEM